MSGGSNIPLKYHKLNASYNNQVSSTMSFLLRGTRQQAQHALARPVASAASFRPLAGATIQTTRTYAESTTKGAQPKILNQSPPDENNASEEVKAHNKEVDKRADRPQEKVKGEDVEKDKVPKGYWQGSKSHPETKQAPDKADVRAQVKRVWRRRARER